MKVLILICSSQMPPYDLFLKAQKETWDSIDHAGCETAYYTNGGTGWNGNVFHAKAEPEYYLQHAKFKECLQAIDLSRYDMIFRTHSSSYVDKELLYGICKNFPTERLYGGVVIGEGLPDVEWEGAIVSTRVISGAGIFMSMDVAAVLRDTLPMEVSCEEDVLIGRTLQVNGYGITYAHNQRCDMTGIKDYRPSFHYRIKSHSRENDIKTMYELHKMVMR